MLLLSNSYPHVWRDCVYQKELKKSIPEWKKVRCYYNVSCSHPRKQQFCHGFFDPSQTWIHIGWIHPPGCNRHQQDDIFRFGNPKVNLHWPVLLAGGVDPTYKFCPIPCNQRPQILQPCYGTNELKSRWYNGTVLKDAGCIAVMSTMQGATTIPTMEWLSGELGRNNTTGDWNLVAKRQKRTSCGEKRS